MYRASQLGGEEWFGYSSDSERLATLIDRVALQTKATAVSKVHLNESEMVPRPDYGGRSAVVSSQDAESVAALFAMLG